MLRYEITTSKPGVILPATLINRIASTRVTRVVVCYVEAGDAKQFEQDIQNTALVVKYNVYPPDTGAAAREWKRQ